MRAGTIDLMEAKRKVGTLKNRSETGDAVTGAPSGQGASPNVRAGTKAKDVIKSAALTEDRKGQLLEEAARLFGARGYDRTSMRDIAAAFGILPGSLYHHFGSKDELFAAVYAQGVTQFIAAVQQATSAHDDPWKRLEAGCVAHLETLVTRDSAMAAVLADWSKSHSDELRATLIRERDRYELVFSALVAAIPLPSNISRRYFRLSLLGAFNWTLTWFRPGKDSPAVVARQMLAVFRVPL